MKRILAVWSLCLIASFGSFGALLIADRSLGLPLPYSLPLAFAGITVAGALLLFAAAAVWPRRPIVVAAPRPVVMSSVPPAGARATRQAAQGVVVLFDMASV
jgi:hypothetical protein